MQKKSFTLIFFSLLLLTFGCANQSNKSQEKVELKSSDISSDANDSEEKSEEEKQKAAKALAEIEGKLQKLVADAKDARPEAIQYLSRDIFMKAETALLAADYETAAVLFKYVAKLNPDDTYLKTKWAVALIKANKMEESEAVLKEAYLQTKGQDTKIGLILAGVYTALERPVDARSIYSKVLAIDEKNADACIFLAKSYAVDKQTGKAEQLLNNCEKKIKQNGIFAFYRGKIALDKNDVEKALKNFELALKLQPELYQALIAMGLIYEDQGKTKKAIELYQSYLQKNPEDRMILGRLVQSLFAQERFAEAIPYVETLSQLTPDDLNLKVKLGILYTDAKNLDKAIVIFKDLLKFAPDSDKILYYLGAIYQELDQYESSIGYFQKIPSKSSLYQDSVVQISHMLSILSTEAKKNGDKDQEKEFFGYVHQKIEEHEDLKVELSVIKATYLENFGEVVTAVKTLENVQGEKNFGESHLYYLASMYEKEKQYEKSANLMHDLIKKNPKNAHAWNFLGYSLLERGTELDKAYSFISKAVKLVPNDGFIRDSLGWYYYRVGRYNEALKEIELARKHAPDDAVIAKHLAMVYQALNRYNEAKEFYKQALKNARMESEREDISRELTALEKMHSREDRAPASKR